MKIHNAFKLHDIKDMSCYSRMENYNNSYRITMLADQKMKEDLGEFVAWAKSVYPSSEVRDKFQELFRIYIAVKRVTNGLHDWYGIFGVDPMADEDVIEARYKKLALALHPDKNQTVDPTGEVFKILSEGRSILLDKTERDAYNSMINLPEIYEKATDSESPANARKRNYYTSSSTKMKTEKVPMTWNEMRVSQAGATKSYPTTSSTQNEGCAYHFKTGLGSTSSKPKTFWTSCDKCKFEFEYTDNFRNKKLLCRHCQKPFRAREIPPPPEKEQIPFKN
ncbi:hypothetical protein M9H77_09476 [Catharanthus roseus]|uniref:Uncharacterized protein n=1 Tax=Catharanthus roseus TaxID=4058 RepID=A0ACC0C0S3_CATRO|nr:hypothetical protein M9H77_09476 [Catharanthus roseus]